MTAPEPVTPEPTCASTDVDIADSKRHTELIAAARNCVELGLHVHPHAAAAILNQLDTMTDEYDTERHQRLDLAERMHDCQPRDSVATVHLNVGDEVACLWLCQQPWRVTTIDTDPHGDPVISWERA